MQSKMNGKDFITSILNSGINKYDNKSQYNATLSHFNDKCKQIWSNWDDAPKKEDKKLHAQGKTDANNEYALKKPSDTTQTQLPASVYKTPNRYNDDLESSSQVSTLKSECDELISRIQNLTGNIPPTPPINLKSPSRASYASSNSSSIKSTKQTSFNDTPIKGSKAYVPLTPLMEPNIPEVERLRKENNDLKARLSILKQQQTDIQQKRIELEAKLEQQEKMREFYKQQRGGY